MLAFTRHVCTSGCLKGHFLPLEVLPEHRMMQMHLANIMQTEYIGAGFMIGSAFAVVLPEGFEVLYSSGEAGHSHINSRHLRSESVAEEADSLMALPQISSQQRRVLLSGHDHNNHMHGRSMPCPQWAPGAALLAGFLAMIFFEHLHHSFEGIHKGGQVRSSSPVDCSL
jgi:hypothetical protein